MKPLDDALRAAHVAGDTDALIRLYAQAAEGADTSDSAAFYLTHAYVFALETGDARADGLREKLVAVGREEPLDPARPPLR
ncbi:MAG: hypothetical protein AB8B60_01100 [Sulfitobacter sp.]